MSDKPAGQEAQEKQVMEITDEELLTMDEEQRNAWLEGDAEIQWTDDEKKALGKDVQEGEPQVGPEQVLKGISERVASERQFEERAESSTKYQKLRRRAQKAEQDAELNAKRVVELEAENRAFKAALDKFGDEDQTIDLDDPEALDKYIKEQQEIQAKELESEERPKFEHVKEPAPAERPRFFDTEGNVFNPEEVDNPDGLPFFRVRDEQNKEHLLFDQEVLDDYDKAMYERYGEELYAAMWGTAQQPGLMAVWRNNAPLQDVLAVMSSPDPVSTTLQVYERILATLMQQEQQKGAQPTQQKPPVQQPAQKDVRPAPRGFGAAPITDSDEPPKTVSPQDISDAALAKMSQEDRDRWLGQE